MQVLPEFSSPYIIAPSILSADFARLGEEATAVIEAGADMIHFDVMDNHYVPNLTMGPMFCKALRNYGITAPIDVHLMVKPVDALIESFAEAGATIISFHPEASEHVDRSIKLIRASGCHPGLVLNPSTPTDCLDWVLDQLYHVLVMSVNPGFGGQSFLPHTLHKLKQVRSLIDHRAPHVRLEVDGGIKENNIAAAAKAGADMFVAGSAIFGASSYADKIQAFREAIMQGMTK